MFFTKLNVSKRAASLSIVVVLLLTTISAAANNDPEAKRQAMALKGNAFVIRTADGIFDAHPGHWKGAEVSLDNNIVSIDSDADWQSRYFMSGTKYVLKEVKYNENEDRLHLRFDGGNQHVLLNITHAAKVSGDQLKSVIYEIMLRPGESIEQARAANDKAMIATYFMPDPDLSKLSQSEQLKLLNTLRTTGVKAPKLERIGGDLYAPVELPGDGPIYNDLKVNKNQRLASTIEFRLPEITAASKRLDLPSVVKGLKVSWRDLHQSFLPPNPNDLSVTRDLFHGSVERIEMLIRFTTLKEVSGGNLSAAEMLQQSVLRVDGMKVTFTTFEPI